MTTATAHTPPRPIAPPVRFDEIPPRLKEGRRHVLWGYRLRGGKWTKPPFRCAPCDIEAKVDDPTTWTTFAEAQRGLSIDARRNGSHRFDGLGFVFARDDNLCGLDLDDCRDPQTGELHPDAAKIVSNFRTYCEISPGGRGVKLIFEGALPTDRTGTRRKSPWWAGAIEMYHHGRYFTLTGNRLPGTPDAIANCQEQASQLWATITAPKAKPPAATNDKHDAPPSPDVTDEKILAKARASKQGVKFETLFNGDLSAYRNDHSAADQALCNMLVFWAGRDAQRVDRLFRQSGLMRDKWDEVHYSTGETYGEATISKAIEAAGETYDWSKAGKRPKKKSKPTVGAGRPKPAQPSPASNDVDAPAAESDGTDELPCILDADGQTDIANAQRFAYLHGNEVRYCDAWGKWLVWDGRRWAFDDVLSIDARARDVPTLLWRTVAQAMPEIDDDLAKQIVAFARASSNDRSLAAMLRQARSQPNIPIRADLLDTDPWLLNCPNGTLDLRTGELRPHCRDDLITKLCPSPYDPSAACPLWSQSFLPRIMHAQTDVITFLQRAVGYSLTGSVREEILFFLWGTGRNGKSKFLAALQNALGPDYSYTAPHDFLMARDKERHPTDLADLAGKRFVTTIETEDGKAIAEALVKQITGGDEIRARRMREDFWSFKPTHKVWLAANHKPRIRGNDGAIWDRIKLVPFTVYIPPEERDKQLEQKLAAEAPGILAWAVRGCLDWQAYGLGEPQAVAQAVNDYRQAEDVFAQYVAERCITDADDEGNPPKAPASSLYADYRRWCELSGLRPVTKTKLTQLLSERGYPLDNGRRNYQRIGLLVPEKKSRDENFRDAEKKSEDHSE